MFILQFFIGLLFLFFAIYIYLIPSNIAARRQHSNYSAILVFNVVFGWTLVGWILALVWSLTGVSSDEDDEPEDTKRCPFCAEVILAAACVCKHCGRDLPLSPEPDPHENPGQ